MYLRSFNCILKNITECWGRCVQHVGHGPDQIYLKNIKNARIKRSPSFPKSYNHNDNIQNSTSFHNILLLCFIPKHNFTTTKFQSVYFHKV